jgi:dCMP deaminase
MPTMAVERPSFTDIYMALAKSLAARSTCEVERVGTVITSADFRKVLAVGYTGNASGLPNHCDQPGPDCGCLHAEDNAIIHCDAPRADPKIVFTTKVPCRACAKRLINLGGVQDLYAAEGGSEPSLELFATVGIRVYVTGA